MSFWIKEVGMWVSMSSFSACVFNPYSGEDIFFCPEWRDLNFDFHFRSTEKWRKFVFESHQSLLAWEALPGAVIIFPSLSLPGRWKTPGLFWALKTEPPLKPSELAAEICEQRVLKEQRPSGYADSVSPFLASKNKGIPEKIRAGPHPKPPLPFLPPPPFLFLTHTHTQFRGNMHTHTHRQHSPAKVISCNRRDTPPSLLYNHADLISSETWLQRHDKEERMGVCKCVGVGNMLSGPNAYFRAISVCCFYCRCWPSLTSTDWGPSSDPALTCV